MGSLRRSHATIHMTENSLEMHDQCIPMMIAVTALFPHLLKIPFIFHSTFLFPITGIRMLVGYRLVTTAARGFISRMNMINCFLVTATF